MKIIAFLEILAFTSLFFAAGLAVFFITRKKIYLLLGLSEKMKKKSSDPNNASSKKLLFKAKKNIAKSIWTDSLEREFSYSINFQLQKIKNLPAYAALAKNSRKWIEHGKQ